MKRAIALALALLMTLSAPAVAQKADADVINIGVVYPEASIDGDTFYREGLELAFEQVNASGGVLGKRLEPAVYDDNNDITTALIIAQAMIDNKIPAVIGHWSSNVCYVVKDLYEAQKTVMISPAATSESLMEEPGQYVFRTIPGCEMYAEVMAEDMEARGLKNIAIYYTDDVYGFAYANYLEKSLAMRGIEVVDRISSLSASSAQRVADRWAALGADGVFVAAVMPDALNIINLIRAMHPSFPVYGAENFDRRSFRSDLNGDVSRIHVAGFDLKRLDPSFLSAFKQKYAHDPDAFAVTGYMAVMMLKDAFEAVGTTDPEKVAAHLASLEGYPSVGGTLSYDPDNREFYGHALCVRAIDLD